MTYLEKRAMYADAAPRRARILRGAIACIATIAVGAILAVAMAGFIEPSLVPHTVIGGLFGR